MLNNVLVLFNHPSVIFVIQISGSNQISNKEIAKFIQRERRIDASFRRSKLQMSLRNAPDFSGATTHCDHV